MTRGRSAVSERVPSRAAMRLLFALHDLAALDATEIFLVRPTRAAVELINLGYLSSVPGDAGRSSCYALTDHGHDAARRNRGWR